MKRIARGLAALLLSIVAAGASAQEILEQILVKVNGEIITKTDLEQRQIQALRQRNPNFRPSSDAELQKALGEITPDVIVNFVDEMLLVQRGRELGYALGNEQFRNIIENIKKENKIETEEAFQAALKQEGLTLDDLRRQLERQMLVSRVQQDEVDGKISVTEEEIKQTYESSKDKFTTEPQLTLREFLVTVPASDKGINVAQDDAAKAKAEDVRKRIDAGEPFARLVADLSDSPSKANAGLIGPIARTDLSPELLKMIDPLKPGETTPVIRTTRGYQIFKLESATARSVKSMEDARPEVANAIAGRKRQGQLMAYLQHLRTLAIIDWKNDEVKKAYEVGLKQQQAAAPTPTK